jgi:hypothetical protein
MKECSKCKIEKELDEFNKHSNSKTKTSSYCILCQKIYVKNHYENNKEEYTKSRFKFSKWFLDYKLTLKCERCGFDHPATLDFHHKDPKTKEFGITIPNISGKSKEDVFNEMKKCEVLCSNCHRIEHSKIYNNYIKTGV